MFSAAASLNGITTHIDLDFTVHVWQLLQQRLLAPQLQSLTLRR